MYYSQIRVRSPSETALDAKFSRRVSNLFRVTVCIIRYFTKNVIQRMTLFNDVREQEASLQKLTNIYFRSFFIRNKGCAAARSHSSAICTWLNWPHWVKLFLPDPA